MSKRGILMYRRGNHLEPAAQLDADDLLAYPEGHVVTVTIVRRRSDRQERFLWALVTMVADGIGRDRNLLYDQILFELGMVEPVDAFGRTYYRLKSTSRTDMPSSEAYNAFVTRVIDLVIERLLPGIKKVEIARRVETMLRLDHHVEDALS